MSCFCLCSLSKHSPDPNLWAQAALQKTQNIDSWQNNKKILPSLIRNKNTVTYKTGKSVQIFSNVDISIQRIGEGPMTHLVHLSTGVFLNPHLKADRAPIRPFSGASESPSKTITLNLLVISLS